MTRPDVAGPPMMTRPDVAGPPTSQLSRAGVAMILAGSAPAPGGAAAGPPGGAAPARVTRPGGAASARVIRVIRVTPKSGTRIPRPSRGRSA